MVVKPMLTQIEIVCSCFVSFLGQKYSTDRNFLLSQFPEFAHHGDKTVLMEGCCHISDNLVATEGG